MDPLELFDNVLRYWPIVLAFSAALVWFVRLEGTVKWFFRELDIMHKQRGEDLDAVKVARGETNALIEKMDVRIEKGFGEIRSDIKELLRQDRH